MLVTIAKITVDSGSFYKIGTTKSDRYDMRPTTSGFYRQLEEAECTYREVYTRITSDPSKISKKVLTHPSVTKLLGAENLLIVKDRPVSGAKHNCFNCDDINALIDEIDVKKDLVFVTYEYLKDREVKVSIETVLPKIEFTQIPEDAATAKLNFFKKGSCVLAKTKTSVTFKTTLSLEELQGTSSYFQISEIEENVYKCFCSAKAHPDSIFLDFASGVYGVREKNKLRSLLPADINLTEFFCKDVDGLINEYKQLKELPKFVNILKLPDMYRFYISTATVDEVEATIKAKEPFGTTLEARIEIKPYLTFETLMTLVRPVGEKRSTFELLTNLSDLIASIKNFLPPKAARMPSVYIVSFAKEGLFRVGLTDSDILSKQSIPDGVIVYSKIVHNENIAMNVFDNMKGYEVKTEYPGKYYEGSLECLGKLMALVKS